jgi:hypothetical protein
VADGALLNSLFTLIKGRTAQLSTYNYLNSFWYNAPFLEGLVINTYQVSSANDQVAAMPDPTVLNELGYVNFVLTQNQVQVKTRAHRNALGSTLITLGGFICVLRNITCLIIAGWQDFSHDKSFIKKLYSWDDGDAPKPDDDDHLDDDQRKVKAAIKSRKIFSYSYSQAYADWFWTKLHVFFCWCGCGPRQKGVDERIHNQGQTKLYNEIDLLTIVKHIRISQFLGQALLSKNQRELVKFMKQYTMYTKQPK